MSQADRVLDNLPLPLNRFIGRAAEISALKQRVWSTRLLTLTGPGGCGKTRLALKVAEDLRDAFGDGAWLVELAPLADATLIARTIMTALGMHEQTGRTPTEALIEQLQQRELLLVLDNCEHLIDGCASLAMNLLQRCSDLRILATSREALNIAAEITWPVPPLSMIDPHRSVDAAALQTSEAASLFLDRATAAQADFAVSDQAAPAIAQICRRLDGMPLAIELAAARVKMLAVDQIAARLDDRFNLLSMGSRTAPARHQTLHAMIDWSYGLLSATEKILFRRLTVFAGGWTLEAAEAVCADEKMSANEVLPALSHLVDKSIIIADKTHEQGQETRYRMLETIRQYAQEKLAESVDEMPIRDRHLDYFVEWVERAEPELYRPQRLNWLNRLEADYDNLRAAAAWAEACRQTGNADQERGLRLVGALFYYWHARGHLSEARRWANTALAGTSSRTLARANALRVAGWLAWRMHDSITARAKLEESAAIYHEWGEAGRWGLAETLNHLGNDAWQRGDNISAQKYYEESLDLRRAVGNIWGIAQSLNNLGSGATVRGDYEAARSPLAEGLATARAAGDMSLVSLLLWSYGENLVAQGDEPLARAHWAEGLRICQELDDIWRAAGIMRSVAELESRSGQTASFEKAARLWGATEALLTARGDVGLNADYFDRDVAAARAQLGGTRFEAAWAEGQAMKMNEAIDYALAVLEASSTGDQSAISPPPRATKQQFGGLTAREREVAALVAQGKANREIAEALVVELKTVEAHITRILNKLGFDNRVQIATWAVNKGLVPPGGSS